MSQPLRFRDVFPPVPTAAWEDAIRSDLKGADYEATLFWEALEGVAVRAFYRSEDLAALAHRPSDVASLRPAPQAEPANAWSIRQDIDAADPDLAARLLREAVDGGATDVGLPVAHGPGVRRLVDLVDPGRTGIHLYGPEAADHLGAVLDALEARGLDPERLRGSVHDDPLGQHARTGTGGLDAGIRRLARCIADPSTPPDLRVVTADAEPFHDAGADLVDETAALLAGASEYLARLGEQGIEPADTARRLQVAVPIGPSYFLEIARMRALRLLWTQVFGAYAPSADPVPLRVQAVTSRRTRTLYDPHVNLLRGTTAAAAAIVGGCDVLTVRPYDPAAERGLSFGLRMARNIQLILKHEAGFDRVRDPAAGAYYLEVLTDRLAARVWRRFQEIEAEGGLVAALHTGALQNRIDQARRDGAAAVAQRRRILVGTNHYPDPAEHRLEAVEAGRRGSLPEPDDGAGLSPTRDGEAFERMRLRTERHARQTGRVPTVLLLPFGEPALRTTRARFAAGVFGCAGFRIREAAAIEHIEEAAEVVRAGRPDVVVLCAADDAYPDLARSLVPALAELSPRPLVAAAGPAPTGEHAPAAGIDVYVHRQQSLLELLIDVQRRLGFELDS